MLIKGVEVALTSGSDGKGGSRCLDALIEGRGGGCGGDQLGECRKSSAGVFRTIMTVIVAATPLPVRANGGYRAEQTAVSDRRVSEADRSDRLTALWRPPQ